MHIYVPFTKSDDEERMVYGYASTEAMDSQGEIVSKVAIEEALPDYMKFANIREMHTSSAVGKAHEAVVDENGLWLGVKVVDDNAWKKVKEGVYNGFSIGGKLITKVNDTITKMRLTEISLVDRPANPEAVFSFYKGEDMPNDDEAQNVETTEEAQETEKGEVTADIKKSIYDVGRVGSAMMYLNETMESQEWGATFGEDNAAVISQLRDSLNKLVEVYKTIAINEADKFKKDGDMTDDAKAGESMEELAAKSYDAEDVAKAGASISASNKAKLQSIISTCKEMMGEMEAEKSEADGDIAKGDDIAKAEEINMLKSELSKANDDIAKKDARIKELEAQPEAPKGVLKSIAKGEDYDGGKSDEEVLKGMIVKDSKGDINEIATLIKFAQQHNIAPKIS